MSAKRIVVAGGSGFLGSRICKSAVARGWNVTSLSRSGEPRWDLITSSSQPPRWSKSVEWAKADILKPSTYKPFLKDANAVVHSMGILLEADYKGIVQGRESIISGLQKVFSSSRPGSQDPLQRKEGEELDPKEKDKHLTYELMNRDSAVALAQESTYEHVETFAFISASSPAPVIPGRYISTKREAESTIALSLPDIRSVFIRPSFMYDSSRKLTMPIALGGILGSEINSLLGGKLQFLGAMTEKPLQVDIVGEAVIEAIGDNETSGAVGPKKIETLATKGWRRNML